MNVDVMPDQMPVVRAAGDFDPNSGSWLERVVFVKAALIVKVLYCLKPIFLFGLPVFDNELHRVPFENKYF